MSNRCSHHARGMRRVIGAAGVCALGIGVLLAGPATADQGPIDLVDGYNARFDGGAVDDYSGSSVAGAGDVNGDGQTDMIIGSPGFGDATRANVGAAYVLFGSETPSSVDLLDPGKAGFRIVGNAAYDWTGWSVASAGDVNGDGYDDVVLGAPFVDGSSEGDVGAAYVVFGSAEPTDVDLASITVEGIRIDGIAGYDWTGNSVAGAGDINADGYSDVIVGAPYADAPGRDDAGVSFVIFGSDKPSDVDLAALTTEGVRIDGAAEFDLSGTSVAGAGDVNADGYPDVLIGAYKADVVGGWDGGATFVVFGSEKPADLDLASLSGRGFRIDGVAQNDQSGWAVAGAGDVNHDSYADILIGAPKADSNDRTNSGSSYIVFGSEEPDHVDLAALGERGFRIDGAAAGDTTGRSVSGIGDINSDTLRDVIVGSPFAAPNSRTNAGSSFVVYGKTDTHTVDLASPGERGFRIDGAATNDTSGEAVAGPGDVNSDGSPDILIGASGADNNGRSVSGSSYLVLKTPPVFTVPGAPTGLTGTPGNGEVTLAWTAPDNGGSPITGYRIDSRTGDGPWASTTTGTDTTHTATGLTNGTAYQFRIAAINAAGAGPDSAIAGPYVPRTVPGAPTGLTGTPGNGEVQLTWTAPDNGGSPITGYRIDTRTGDGPWTSTTTDTDTDTTHTATGLTNGTAYQFRVAAINAAGTGPDSAVTGPLTPVTPSATLTVTARKATKPAARTGKTTLVRSITAGPGQRVTTSVKITPKRAAKKITVKTGATKVTVRAKKAPKARIRVTITASATGMTPATWTRRWKVR
ncbi:MAG: hypothetical protein E6Q91_04800 [Actinobacteria bacterium]|nr:MAG: hypothetical protein E6Q91_04800 [Actinomycetota bacterium]